ncbi:hypothetical protein N5K55_21795 [Pseudomonas aeruginosa]|nr:hypothetical protein [Pseudomonas aeruginosa]
MKVAYINAFNKMEQAIIEQSPEILSYNHLLLQFAIKTLDLMRDHTLGERLRFHGSRTGRGATTWPSSFWTR